MGINTGSYQIQLVLKRICTIKCGVCVPSLVGVTHQGIEVGTSKKVLILG
jgi:hypothetical protein